MDKTTFYLQVLHGKTKCYHFHAVLRQILENRDVANCAEITLIKRENILSQCIVLVNGENEKKILMGFVYRVV